jgi:hypothetical protein
MKVSGVKGLSEVFTLVNNNLNVFECLEECLTAGICHSYRRTCLNDSIYFDTMFVCT